MVNDVMLNTSQIQTLIAKAVLKQPRMTSSYNGGDTAIKPAHHGLMMMRKTVLIMLALDGMKVGR